MHFNKPVRQSRAACIMAIPNKAVNWLQRTATWLQTQPQPINLQLCLVAVTYGIEVTSHARWNVEWHISTTGFANNMTSRRHLYHDSSVKLCIVGGGLCYPARCHVQDCRVIHGPATHGCCTGNPSDINPSSEHILSRYIHVLFSLRFCSICRFCFGFIWMMFRLLCF